eukprot:8318483-Pyramimonas_sp.AAC.1
MKEQTSAVSYPDILRLTKAGPPSCPARGLVLCRPPPPGSPSLVLSGNSTTRVTARELLDKIKAESAGADSSSSSESDSEGGSSSSSSSESEEEGEKGGVTTVAAGVTTAEDMEEDVAVGLLSALASAKKPSDKLRALLLWADMQHPGALKMEDELSKVRAGTSTRGGA